MHFFSKNISNLTTPSKDDLENKYLLLVQGSLESCYTWCGSFNLKSTCGYYKSKCVFIKYIKNKLLLDLIGEYEGSLNFPLKRSKVYLVDKIGYDLYCKIKTARDLIVFLDNLNK